MQPIVCGEGGVTSVAGGGGAVVVGAGGAVITLVLT